MCNTLEDKSNISLECFGILSFLEEHFKELLPESRSKHSINVDCALLKEATSKPLAGLIANKEMSLVARWTQQ